MKTHPPILPSACVLAAAVFIFAPLARAQSASPRQNFHPNYVPNPWLGDAPRPTAAEHNLLLGARIKAEVDPAVAAATKTYADTFVAADNLVRQLMFDNPAINNPDLQGHLAQYKEHQLLHSTQWSLDSDHNSPDILLPTPTLTSPDEQVQTLLVTVRDALENNQGPDIVTKTSFRRSINPEDLLDALKYGDPIINRNYQSYTAQYLDRQFPHAAALGLGSDKIPDTLVPHPKTISFNDGIAITKMSGAPSSGPRLSPAQANARDLANLERAAQYNPRAKADLPRTRAFYALDDIYQDALARPEAQAALQKVRDAYQALDAAVRAAMKKDSALAPLVDQYPALFYGRRDLGYYNATFIQG